MTKQTKTTVILPESKTTRGALAVGTLFVYQRGPTIVYLVMANEILGVTGPTIDVVVSGDDAGDWTMPGIEDSVLVMDAIFRLSED